MSLKLVSFVIILSFTMVTSGAMKKTGYKHSIKHSINSDLRSRGGGSVLATIIQQPHQSLVGSAKKITYHRQNICLIKPDNLMCYASNKAPGNKTDVLKIFDLVQVSDDGKSNDIENQNLKIDGLDADYYQETGTVDGVMDSKINYKSQDKYGELDSSEYTDDSNFNNEDRAGQHHQDGTDKIKDGKNYTPKYDPDAWYEHEDTDDVQRLYNITNESSRLNETNDSIEDLSTEVTVRPKETTTYAGYSLNSQSVDNDTKNDSDFENNDNDTEESDENESKDTKNQDDSADNDDSINSKEVGKGTIVIL